MERCPWCGKDELYVRYHDLEWGVPVHNDRLHFEFLILEGVQAGLSWLAVLRKRENYRRAYDGFDPRLVAQYGPEKLESLLQDTGLIRNRSKIEASVHNARRFLEIQREFGSFDRYIWRFVDFKPVINAWEREEDIPAFTALSEEVSKDLKSRGFKFVGPTIVYSHLQATGLINDHIKSCFRYRQLGGR